MSLTKDLHIDNTQNRFQRNAILEDIQMKTLVLAMHLIDINSPYLQKLYLNTRCQQQRKHVLDTNDKMGHINFEYTNAVGDLMMAWRQIIF